MKIFIHILFILIIGHSCTDIASDNREDLFHFNIQDNKLHYFIYVIHDCHLEKLDKAKQAITAYHDKFFKLAKLRISNIYLNPKEKDQLILVRSFSNRNDVLNYASSTRRHISNFLDIEDSNLEMYPVSQLNYKEIVKQKTIKNFKPFYNSQYTQ